MNAETGRLVLTFVAFVFEKKKFYNSKYDKRCLPDPRSPPPAPLTEVCLTVVWLTLVLAVEHFQAKTTIRTKLLSLLMLLNVFI